MSTNYRSFFSSLLSLSFAAILAFGAFAVSTQALAKPAPQNCPSTIDFESATWENKEISTNTYTDYKLQFNGFIWSMETLYPEPHYSGAELSFLKILKQYGQAPVLMNLIFDQPYHSDHYWVCQYKKETQDVIFLLVTKAY